MTKYRPLRLFLLALVVASALVVIWLRPWRTDSPKTVGELPPPPYSETRFLNTGPDAQYIGVAACAECHGRQHQSYLLTAHSRALGDIDLADEPPDSRYFHEASGRHYRVYRQGKEMRHEEVLRDEKGQEVARLDLPVHYRIGSGNFTRSYLIEQDGFLLESPITWYAARKQWDMSPGYDRPNHQSFERPVEIVCLSCHAGRVEPVDQGLRVRLHEQVIGCESCHGPGSLHRDRHRSGTSSAGEEDRTIVNPAKLSRKLLEAVCGNCHQSGAASILVRGRTHADFRPGRPMTDFRIDYEFDAGNEQMTVVGHMEQLRRSRCYQKSGELSCLTCHEPHLRAPPKDPVAYFRQKCLDCHVAKGCSVAEAERRRRNAADNCAACHMPRGATDIPHIAFTHHRIGRHEAVRSKRDAPDKVPDLIPSFNVSQLSVLDRKRNLGMAYVVAAQNPEHGSFRQEYLRRARELLETVQAEGLQADESAAALAELVREEDREHGDLYGQRLLKAAKVPGFVRTNIQSMLANSAMNEGRFEAAYALISDLTRLRRSADDWRILGAIHMQRDEPEQAWTALQQALAIRPFRPSIYSGLVEVGRRLGKTQQAAEYETKGRWLAQHNQD